jgi:hypothetical protein
MQTLPLKLIPEGGGFQDNTPTDSNFIEDLHPKLEPQEPDTQRRTLSVLSSSCCVVTTQHPNTQRPNTQRPALASQPGRLPSERPTPSQPKPPAQQWRPQVAQAVVAASDLKNSNTTALANNGCYTSKVCKDLRMAWTGRCQNQKLSLASVLVLRESYAKKRGADCKQAHRRPIRCIKPSTLRHLRSMYHPIDR